MRPYMNGRWRGSEAAKRRRSKSNRHWSRAIARTWSDQAMTLTVLIARFTAVGMIVFGLSHLLMAGLWSELLSPLRDRKSGGLLLGAISLPFGLAIVLGHNVWVWGLPVIVTVLGWLITLKCTIYLLVPWAHRRAMPT